MTEHLEPQLRIFVEHLDAGRLVVAAMLGNEVCVPDEAFEILQHLLPAGGAGIARQGRAAIGDELVEVVGHGVLPDVGFARKYHGKRPGINRITARWRRPRSRPARQDRWPGRSGSWSRPGGYP